MKLRTNIILLITPIILIQMILLVVPSIWLYKEFVNEQVSGLIQQSVTQINSAFDTKVKSVKADSELFSQNVVLNRYIRTEDTATKAYVMEKVLLKEFSSYQLVHPDYTEISYIAVDGKEEVSLQSQQYSHSNNQQNSPYFKAISNSPNTHEELVMLNPNTQQWVLVSTRKIYQQELTELTNSTPAEIKGYLIIKVSLDFLDSYMSTNHLNHSGFAILYDNQSNILLTKGKKIDIESIHSLFSEPYTENKNSQTYSVRLDKETYLLGHTILANNLQYTIGWPESELDNVLTKMAYTALMISIILLIVSAIFLFWMLNKKLIIPILKLKTAAKLMGEGDRDWKLTPNISEELHDLELSVKQMGENLIKQRQQMHDAAYIDSLTELPNRLHFTEMLSDLFKTPEKLMPGVALLFLDLDGFKHVNDTVGHEGGDKVLIAFAKRLKHALRAKDIIGYSRKLSPALQDYNVARLGGDEFTVLLKGIHHDADVISVVERILNVFSRPIHFRQKSFRLGVSIGIAMANENDKSSSELIKKADIAMYQAKQAGKNTYRFFSQNSASQTLKLIEMKEALCESITKNQLSLVYQPQICSKSGKLLSCEALVRWKHPDYGWVSPDVFIPLAEETGFIVLLGRWVIGTVCSQIAEWLNSGFNVPRVSVNVSNIQFAKDDVHRFIVENLLSYRIGAEYLTVEVTETSIMQDKEALVQLEKIKQEGVRTSLDDFGTGYSSLSALKGLPISELKIDKSFIQEIEKGEDGKTIVAAIIAMAKALKLELVAEGVETEGEFNFIRKSEVEIIQGYYFYKPLNPDDFSMLIKESITSKNTDAFESLTDNQDQAFSN